MDYGSMSVDEIVKIVLQMDLSEKKKVIDSLQGDTRKGIINLIKRLKKEIEDHDSEMERLLKLKEYEYKYFKKGAKYIAGIDEVGRGPLAGPVYASAVVFDIDCIIEGINDSKKLSPSKRKELYGRIKEKAICCATGRCDEKTIDRINILNATYEAMRQAIEKLDVKPQVILVDAVRIPKIDIFQQPIIKGDSLSFSIGAASIIAKVERDEFMDRLHEQYPVYNFASNKGYGTKEHIEAIREYGPCPAHRRSFIGGIV